jgi:hypothetical protein
MRAKTKGMKSTKGCSAVKGSKLYVVKAGKKLAATRCLGAAKAMVAACWKSVKGTKKRIACTFYAIKPSRTGLVRKGKRK